MADHLTKVEPTTYGMFTPFCSCGWMGGDWSSEQAAAEEARMHEEGRLQPWQMEPGEQREWNFHRDP